MTPDLSIIIPTINEAANLPATLAPLRPVGNRPGVEVIVVDGGSSDATREIAGAAGCRVLVSPPGRGRQMNLGAAAARAPALLFLHADTLLPAGFATPLFAALNRPGVSLGAFSLAIRDGGPALATIARLANLRARLAGLPYGDQALFTSRRLFQAVGGYPEMAIMEDALFVHRLGRLGRVIILAETAGTSPRRWQNLGICRTTAINQLMLAGYLAGVAPPTLARWYQRLRGLGRRH